MPCRKETDSNRSRDAEAVTSLSTRASSESRSDGVRQTESAIRRRHVASQGNCEKAVVQRDSGRCQACGHEGNQIDHIDGSSSGLKNLQLSCDSCHRAKTELGIHSVHSGDPGYERIHAVSVEVRERVAAVLPMYPCDDDEHWWPDLYQREMKARRALLAK